MAHAGNSSKKYCFVTIGATAAFDTLIRACLESDFLDALSAAGYSNLLLQYGKDGKSLFNGLVANKEKDGSPGIKIEGFGFSQYGLIEHMKLVKGSPLDGSNEGLVISHAGSGSILDALRLNVPLVVVPNPTLLDNHQLELAEILEQQGYVIHGKLDNLVSAIHDAEELRQRQRSWPPINSGQHRAAQGLQGVMDEEMGFLD
ncbi:glycosyltransferase family 28 C-terminal domain-containing protein [Phyllosticta citriasiana]|uniref:glycosyltransferase family 28 C-terminal domain-containing protein n=1 Tax=Phyllosticta citriasiana TaxID=595635 RepID=UPI0030FD535F